MSVIDQQDTARLALLAVLTAEAYGSTSTGDPAELGLARTLWRRAERARRTADRYAEHPETTTPRPREEVTV